MPPLTAAMMQSIRKLAAEKKPAFGEGESHIPVEHYFSHEQWNAEIAALFRKLPLIVAHSSELLPGQVMAHDGYGLPLLLSRDKDDTLRCFLNVCRHRGMRLVDAAAPLSKASVVCPYHGWTYKLDGELRHMPHAEAFSPCPTGERNLTALPCAERFGLIWVVPDPQGMIDLDAYLDAYLGALNTEMPWYEIDQLVTFRTIEAEYPANWKLIVDAFLESYHIRVLHRDTISPFFSDGITASERIGPHIYSLVARREALETFAEPESHETLRELVTPSQVIFPNTITIFHPDYLSLVSLYPVGSERLRWVHRMLIPRDKATPDWAPHWEKTFNLIEQGVFQKEDIHAAVEIQKGLRSGANRTLTIGRLEEGLTWFYEQVCLHTQGLAK
ncbi:MAG: Rieske 2Fe-2S domain-containing protein [Burkholderiaceae bacterium]|nr:Rieske 2Fe-2S domain-containing protein [Burkholderiaceae bacterium]